jgi:hypothetical protein
MNKDLFIRRVYTSYGIGVVVELDFVNETISLVEKDGSKKLWDFTGRGPEYLNGWRNIMHAMEYATAEAQKEMQAHIDEKLKDFVKVYQAVDLKLKKGTPLAEVAE